MPDRRRIAGALAALLIAVSHAVADDTSRDLDDVRSEQDRTRAEADRLAEEAHRLRGELAEETARLRDLAKAARAREEALDDLDRQMQQEQVRIAALDGRLAGAREGLAQTLSALAGLVGRPPLAAIADPDGTEDAALAASALAGLREGLSIRMGDIRVLVQEREAARMALAALRESAQTALAARAEESRKLEAVVAARQRKAADLDASIVRTRKRLAALASEAETLTALMRRLDALEPVLAPTVALKPQGFQTLKGRLPPPASGGLARRFGDRADADTGNGIVLLTRAGGLVTAPHDAIVRFAGPFRDRGGLLILDFGDGYHMLVAGLAGLDVAVGQWLLAGEPVGRMPDKAGGERSELYLELRRGGTPIDPAPWLAMQQGRSNG